MIHIFLHSTVKFCDSRSLAQILYGTKLFDDPVDRRFIGTHNRAYLYCSRRLLQRHQHVSVRSTRLISLTQLKQANFTGQSYKVGTVLSLHWDNRTYFTFVKVSTAFFATSSNVVPIDVLWFIDAEVSTTKTNITMFVGQLLYIDLWVYIRRNFFRLRERWQKLSLIIMAPVLELLRGAAQAPPRCDRTT